MRHPDEVLFADQKPLPMLPVVDHYAGSERRIHKALLRQRELGPVFDITCDCEDGAVAGAAAEQARMCAAQVMGAENQFGRVGVRLRGLASSGWEEDLEILVREAGTRLAFLTLPKPESARDVECFLAALRQAESRFGTGHAIPAHVLIETHGALRDVFQIAALPGVESLDFGLMDFVSAHRGAIPAWAMQSPGQFAHPLVVRAKCEIAAAAFLHGICPTHNVTTELRDASVITHDARRARELGFLRMWSIHPDQILPILEALRPDFSEVASAAEILAQAQNEDWGPIQHQGRLHDRASYRYYWECLRRARTTGMALPEKATRRFFPVREKE
ncbi:MAG: CoA ester lyase [Zoogloeaceae bacterium]|jgi:citrate lyase subunit beta/citryl-CoA lyase|nr:CoA ester lyase [Zoogloeaceae bacterium]